MTVYVDAIVATGRTKAWPYTRACHMFATTDEELHAMAKAIGLRREWFQNHASLPHYDLTVSRRELAVRRGAVSVGRWFTVDWMRQLRYQREGAQDDNAE